MLIRNDPFRDLDRLSQQLLGTMARPATMPMDAWRDHDEFVIELDIPGVDPDSIDLDVERHVVTVRAERPQPAEHQNDMITAERPRGVFSRQLVLGESLDTERIRAGYDAGVLVLRIPIAERAKPRKIEIATGSSARTIETHTTGEPSPAALDSESSTETPSAS
jgi:HSP20 family protein